MKRELAGRLRREVSGEAPPVGVKFAEHNAEDTLGHYWVTKVSLRAWVSETIRDKITIVDRQSAVDGGLEHRHRHTVSVFDDCGVGLFEAKECSN